MFAGKELGLGMLVKQCIRAFYKSCILISLTWLLEAKAVENFLGPETIANLVKEVSPAIVNIVSLSPANREQLLRLQKEHKGRRYLNPDTLPDDSGSQVKITGSGVVLRSDGYILTSWHVVQDAVAIKVTLNSQESYEAKLVSKDNFTDLALIKIDKSNLPEARFGDAESLRLGEWVVAIGNQFGLEHTVTCGLISGLHREAKAFTPAFGARTGALKFIQTDASINPGSSGGPLLNLKGEIVGINSFIRDDAQNIGFAIPANIALAVGEKLLKQGGVTYPYIGIEMREPAELPSEAESCQGVEITLVKPLSPANMAGLEPGDVIFEVDKDDIKTPRDVSQAVSRHAIGDKMVVKVKRNGNDKTFLVKVGALPEEIE